MVGGGSTPIGKYCLASRGHGAVFCAGSAFATPSLRMDAYPARAGSVAGFKVRLSQLGLLSSARDSCPRVFHHCFPTAASFLYSTGQGWDPAVYHLDAESLLR